MRPIRTIVPLALVLAAGAAAAPASAAPAATAAAAQEYEGTVVSVNRSARTFRLRDSERGTVRIRVTGRTRFERIAGLSGLGPACAGSRPPCSAPTAAGSRSRSSARAAAASTAVTATTTTDPCAGAAH